MKRLAAIRNEPLSLDEVLAAVGHARAGAITSFSGVVRNHAEGRAVTLLEYEAYPAMAEREMARILDTIEAEIPEVRLAVVHRVGALQVGELAIVCAASAPHREQAFAACHRCIDDIKGTVPIWKREHGPSGPYWVGWHDARCAHGDSTHHGAHEHTAHAHEHTAHAHGHGHAHDHTHRDHAGSKHSISPLDGLRIGVLTASDTRSPKTDESGQVAAQLLIEAGARITAREIVRDEPEQIASWVQKQAPALDAIIVTGGTGIAARDRTIEALEPMLSRTLDGFGEAFRRASFEQIGPRALLSRAKAGIIGTCLVFALPGSPRAVELAVSELVVPILPHAVELLVGKAVHNAPERAREG